MTEAVETKTGEQLIYELAYARRFLQAQETRVCEARAALERLKMYQWAMQESDIETEMRRKVIALEAQVRALAVAAYGETGQPAPFEGVQIKNYTVIYYDQAQALAYCKQEAPMFLTVDTKAWEKAIKAMPTPPAFVTIEKEPRATIATDLSAYLEEPEEAQ